MDKRLCVTETEFSTVMARAKREGSTLGTVLRQAWDARTLAVLTQGIDHWNTDEYGYFGHHYFLGGPAQLRFYGDYHAPGRANDYPIYHPQLMEDFTSRGARSSTVPSMRMTSRRWRPSTT